MLTIISWGHHIQCPAPRVSDSQLLPPQETLQDLQIGLSQILTEFLLCPRSQCTWNIVCALQKWSLCFCQLCGSSCPEAPLTLSTKCFGGSSLQFQTPRMWNLMWDLELSLLLKSLCDNSYFPVCGLLTWQVCARIVKVPHLLSCCGFFFAFACGIYSEFLLNDWIVFSLFLFFYLRVNYHLGLPPVT